MGRSWVRKISPAILRQFLIMIGTVLISACLMFLFLYNFVRVKPSISPSVGVTKTQEEKAETIVSRPGRLRIESLGIDTTIVPVGLTRDGDMAIDDNPDTVAWYQLGPKPGEVGSAVLAGHYGWKDGHGSIFNDLNTMKAGDKILIENQEGVSISFIVREIRMYNPEADATAVFKSTDAKSHLNLISCIGTWVNSAESFSERLVVFADLEQ